MRAGMAETVDVAKAGVPGFLSAAGYAHLEVIRTTKHRVYAPCIMQMKAVATGWLDDGWPSLARLPTCRCSQSRIAHTGSGAEVWQSLEGRGFIGAKELASWIVLEGKEG